jgi:hypothetical protein
LAKVRCCGRTRLEEEPRLVDEAIFLKDRAAVAISNTRHFAKLAYESIGQFDLARSLGLPIPRKGCKRSTSQCVYVAREKLRTDSVVRLSLGDCPALVSTASSSSGEAFVDEMLEDAFGKSSGHGKTG